MTAPREQLERLPPHSLEAEKAVLGSVLRNPSSFVEVSIVLRKEDFYAFAHQKVWEAFGWLSDRGRPIDYVTVFDWFRQKNAVEDLGGPQYLIDLWDGAPTTGAGEHYAKIVRNHSIKREVIHVAGRMSSAAFAPGTQPEAILEEAERMLFQLSQRGHADSQVIDMQLAVREALEVLERRMGKNADGEVEDALMTGWKDLDNITGGIHAGEQVVVAARPSVGKTLWAMNLVANAAAEGKKAFFVSLEQGRTELVLRWFCRKAQVSSRNVRHGILSGGERNSIMDAADHIREWGVHLSDASGQTAAQIVSNARRLHMKHSLDLVVVDYLQLMESESNWGNESQMIGNNARKLKNLARELKVPVIVLSQVNRKNEEQNRRPRMSDLRSSGEIEQHADTVIILHKPEAHNAARDNDTLEVLIEKQRNGPCGEVTLLHRKRFFDIVNYSPGEPPPAPNHWGQYVDS